MKLLALAAALFAAPALAAPPPAKPKLIVVISIDQFSANLFREYRPHFTGGLKRLSEGVVFTNGFQAHASTETCPGHSTILTGNYPAHTGIIANSWINFAAPRDDKAVNCVEDESVPGMNSRDYTVSDVHLRVPTLGDRLKRADPRNRVVSVAGKDRSALLLGGHDADQRWFLKRGRYVPIGAPAELPVVGVLNAFVEKTIATAREPLTPPAFCAAKDKAYQVGGRVIGDTRFARAAGDVDAFANSPEQDAATLSLAAALLQQMKLGKGAGIDLLGIGLSATDYVGHSFGPGGLETCLQLASLDADLAGFFALLDRSNVPYVVAMTADHGGLDMPERTTMLDGQPTARMDDALEPTALGTRIATQLGLTGPIFAGDFYLTPAVPDARRAEVLALARQLVSGHPQVFGVWTKAEVAAVPLPSGDPKDWTVPQRLRASLDAERSPDLFLVTKPGITIYAHPGRTVAGHGTPWDYDRNVPIAFWWKGATPQNRADSALTVDIAPTLASLIGFPLPAGEIDGTCRDIVEGAGDNCAAR